MNQNIELIPVIELPTFKDVDSKNHPTGSSLTNTSVEYNLDTMESMNYFQIKRKLIPVLKKGEQFNFEKAKIEVKAFIASLMILNEEEKAFVNKFQAKIYEPHLLFESKEILERIISHPMAIWKCTLK